MAAVCVPLALACSGEVASAPIVPRDAATDVAPSEEAPSDGDVTFRSDIEPVTRVEDGLPGVLIPPFLDCREALGAVPGSSSIISIA